MATGKAKLVWNDRLVIDDIRQETASLAAANAAFCAADQGKFWTMHDWLFANQASDESAAAFSPSRLSDIGKAAGLDMTKYVPCLNGGTHDASISAASTAEAKTISGTPTIYVDGKFVGQTGAIPSYDEIKAAIDAALAAPAPTGTPAPGPTAVTSPS
jgi:protein-disulfide isomerase